MDGMLEWKEEDGNHSMLAIASHTAHVIFLVFLALDFNSSFHVHISFPLVLPILSIIKNSNFDAIYLPSSFWHFGPCSSFVQ
jgi:hypothetical protein